MPPMTVPLPPAGYRPRRLPPHQRPGIRHDGPATRAPPTYPNGADLLDRLDHLRQEADRMPSPNPSPLLRRVSVPANANPTASGSPDSIPRHVPEGRSASYAVGIRFLVCSHSVHASRT